MDLSKEKKLGPRWWTISVALLACTQSCTENHPHARPDPSIHIPDFKTDYERGQRPDSSWPPPFVKVTGLPSLEIGGEDGDPLTQFHRIQHGVRFSDGRFAIADGGTQEIRYFDENGGPLFAVGGAGDGPGEFRGLGWIAQCGTDSLYVFDRYHARISVLDDTGAFSRSFKIETRGLGGRPYSVSCNRKGLFLVRGWPLLSRNQPPGPFRPNAPFSLLDQEGQEVAFLGDFPADEMYRFNGSIGPRPLGCKTSQALGDDLIFLSKGVTFEIGVFDLYGNPWGLIVKGELAALEFPCSAHTRYVEWRAARETDSGRREALIGALQDVLFPKQRPALNRLFLDSNGEIWVSRFLHPAEERESWILIDARGVSQVEFLMPRGFNVFQFKDGIVVGSFKNRFGVESVQTYDLDYPEPER